MLQTTFKCIDNILDIYDACVNQPLSSSDIGLFYDIFENLSVKDIVKLKLPAITHRLLLWSNLIRTEEEASVYLSQLISLNKAYKFNEEAFKTFYMLNYVLLYIQLYDRVYTELYNKVYALCLYCFDYTCLRENVI